MAEYESLAEFTLTLKDEDEIFCYCTRVTIDDRDLLYFGEQTEVESNPDPTYSSDFLSDLERMKNLGINVSFENDLDSENGSTEYQPTAHLYETPLAEFDPKFEKDVPDMKELGLPLSFCNLKGSEQKVAQFKIVGSCDEFSTNDPLDGSNVPKWEPVDNSSKIDEDFEKYWKKNGETIVRQKWDKIYGEFVVKNNDSEVEKPKEDSILQEDGEGNSIFIILLT